MRTAQAILLFALAVGCGPGRRSFEEPLWLGGVEVQPEVLRRGEFVYMRACRGCHGPGGAGNGPYSASMTPPPADLTRGRYPRIGVAADALPTDAQLRSVVSDGIPGTAMTAQRLSAEDLEAVVQYVKTLAPQWRAPTSTPQRVQ